MTKRKPITQRIVNRVGLQTGEQVASEIERRVNEANRRFEHRLKEINEQTEATIKARVSEAYAEGFDDGNDDPASGQIAAGGMGYRLMSGGGREPTITWEQNLITAWQLIQSNPLVKRASVIKRDYIIGQGIEPKAADPELQTVLDDFWKDNKMPSLISEFARQWSDYGAQVVPAFVRQSDGRVTLAYIDPGLIERVIAHPDNALKMWAVVVKPQQNQDPWVNNTDTQVYRIIRKAEQVVVKAQRFKTRHSEGCARETESIPDLEGYRHACPDCGAELVKHFPARVIEATWHNPNDKPDSTQSVDGMMATHKQAPREPWEQVMLEFYGLTDYNGDCFYVRKNADSNQTIGRSDHMQQADFCDQHDAVSWSLADRERLANLVISILRIAGKDDAVKEWQRKINDWAKDPGSVFVVNESVLDFDMNAPVLNQTSSVATIDMLRKLVLGGEGIPDAWYGSPSGAHLATAQAQGDPTWRTFAHDQGIIQGWFIEMLEFVRDQAIIAGNYVPKPTIEKELDADGNEVEISVEPDTSVTLPMPEMTVKDVTPLASALMSIVSAADMAVARRFATQENAIDLVAKVAAELDVHIDVDELKDAVVNDAQGAALGIGGGDAAENERSWRKVHAALGDGE